MHPRRLARFNELISQTVSKIMLDLKDPEIGFITITGASISADVSMARIFYSVLGNEKEKIATAAALERAKSFVRRELGTLENLRKVPQLMFVYDDGVERADRVNRILHTIQENDAQNNDAHPE